MKIPKALLDELVRSPEIKEQRRQRRIINKFNVTEPIGSIVWLSVGKKIQIIHTLRPTSSRYQIFTDKEKATAFWTKELFSVDGRYKERLEQLNKEKIGTEVPSSQHWWGHVQFIVNEKPTIVVWGEDGRMKYPCPGCGRLFDAYVLNDIPGVEHHIATRIFDPGNDLEDRFEEGGSRGTDCKCSPGKYMRMKCIAVFNKKLLNAAVKAREGFWKSIDEKFGKNKFEHDKYLESPEYEEDREGVIDELFLKFKGEPHETDVYKEATMNAAKKESCQGS